MAQINKGESVRYASRFSALAISIQPGTLGWGRATKIEILVPRFEGQFGPNQKSVVTVRWPNGATAKVLNTNLEKENP